MDAKEVIVGPHAAWPSCIRVIRKGAAGTKMYYPRHRVRPVGIGGEERCRDCETDVRGFRFCPNCGAEVLRGDTARARRENGQSD